MVKCQWCDYESTNLNSLSQHITNKHKKLQKLYYDLFFLKTEEEQICICGKEKKYKYGLSGYYKNCGNIICRNILQNLAERKTCREKYGNETYRNDKLNKETKNERYNNENYNNREKARETCIKKYGVDNPSKNKEIREKIEKIMIKKYGGKSPACSIEIQNKMKDTCVKKYGNEFYLLSEEGKKIKKSKMIELYGTEYALQNEKIIDKMKENNKNKYGYEWPCQQPNFQKKIIKKIKYNDITFDSNFEIDFYKFLKNNNISFEYQPNIQFQYIYDNEIHYYNPDFKVGNKIIEIKGLQFFKNRNPNNEMICPYHKKDETFEQIEWRNGLFEAKHQCMLKNNVKIITNIDDFKIVLTEC